MAADRGLLFDQIDLFCTESDGCSCCIQSDIAAANNGDFLRVSYGGIGAGAEVVGLHKICAGEVFICAIDADEELTKEDSYDAVYIGVGAGLPSFMGIEG